MRVIAIANQKGGVGKTTTAINVSAALNLEGQRVLLLDLDPQGNSSIGLDMTPRENALTMYDLMTHPETDIREVIQPTHLPGLSLIPSNLNLAAAEVTLVDVPARETTLRKCLAPVHEDYDFCLIDCAPSLTLLTVNALMAADAVYVPIQMGYFALEGVQHLTTIIDLVRTELGHGKLRIGGVIITFYDSRQKMSQEVREKVKDHFGSLVFETVIPRTIKLDEAAGYHQTIFEYSRKSAGARAYRELAVEVIRHEASAGE